jgi:uncharacterized protein YbcI
MNKHIRSKGQIEALISEALTSFEKEVMGRGPLETRTYVLDDMIIVRLKGVLTKAEHKLAKSERNEKGRDLIKQVRVELLENARPHLESLIKGITRRKVRALHSDISTSTGEKVIVFTLDRPPTFE